MPFWKLFFIVSSPERGDEFEVDLELESEILIKNKVVFFFKLLKSYFALNCVWIAFFSLKKKKLYFFLLGFRATEWEFWKLISTIPRCARNVFMKFLTIYFKMQKNSFGAIKKIFLYSTLGRPKSGKIWNRFLVFLRCFCTWIQSIEVWTKATGVWIQAIGI